MSPWGEGISSSCWRRQYELDTSHTLLITFTHGGLRSTDTRREDEKMMLFVWHETMQIRLIPYAITLAVRYLEGRDWLVRQYGENHLIGDAWWMNFDPNRRFSTRNGLVCWHTKWHDVVHNQSTSSSGLRRLSCMQWHNLYGDAGKNSKI